MQSITVVGAGFAGLYAALAAVRAGGNRLRVRLVSPEPALVLRPRLYEADPAAMRVDLAPTLAAAGIEFVAGTASGIDPGAETLLLGDGRTVPFQSLVITTGSVMNRPPIPGQSLAYSIDSLPEALALDGRLRTLADTPRPRVVILGAGLTGIELALELRGRVAGLAGPEAARHLEITLVDRGTVAGATLGPQVQPVVADALVADGIRTVLGAVVARIGETGLHFQDGSWLAADLVVLCTGLTAAPFTRALSAAPRSPDGRLAVDDHLRVPGYPRVFAAGDAARAVAAPGQFTLMSCQHAMGSGRFAGENAARDLLGLPLVHYRQPDYRTCLDLGSFGAVLTEGWDRRIVAVGAAAKAMKREINTRWILPPRGNRADVLAASALPD